MKADQHEWIAWMKADQHDWMKVDYHEWIAWRSGCTFGGSRGEADKSGRGGVSHMVVCESK